MLIRNSLLAAVALLGTTGLSGHKPWKELKTGVTVIPGEFEPGLQPDGNSVVFDTPQGLVVLDTGRHPEHSDRILDFAKSLDRPIVAVVNSHWHFDHVSGNPRLRAAHPGLKVYASDAIDGAMHGFLANSRKQAEAYLANPDLPDKLKADIRADMATVDNGKALYPDVVVKQAGEHDFGGRRLHLGLEHAATRGDVWVFDADKRYLATGDLVTLPVPFLDTGCAPRWSAALARLDKLEFDSFAPGHGPVMTHAQFTTYRKAFDGFVKCAQSEAAPKACADWWGLEAGALMEEADRSRTGEFLEYYVGLVRDPAKRAAACD